MSQRRIHSDRALSVNLDHVATLKRLRGTPYPELVHAAGICEVAGADGVTLHLRGDRRHIQESDVDAVLARSHLPLTLEMAPEEETLRFALERKPVCVTLVPERPAELTTEGGLDAVKNKEKLRPVVDRCRDAGIEVTLFLEPDPEQIRTAHELGCDAVELHTGRYAILWDRQNAADLKTEHARIHTAVAEGGKLGLRMNAGHGLYYKNILPLARIPGLAEFSIGHGIVSRAIFTGLEQAVREMIQAIHTGK